MVWQVLGRIGLVPAGGNYKTVHGRIKQLELDTSDFTGGGWNVYARYQTLGKSFSWDSILVEKSAYSFTFRLRNRLIQHGLNEVKCEKCGLAEWFSEPIPLGIHHANGVNNDHRLANLRVLCPSCHALTDTYRGKNQREVKA